MFKRFVALIITLFIFSLVFLTLLWQDVPEMELYNNRPLTKAYRNSQDLGGKWDSYSSLRQAWAQVNRVHQDEENDILTGLNQVNSIVLPSNKGFKVAVKRFQVTGKWGFNSAQLVLEGVYGKVKIFLNGIDEVHYLGEFEGLGGAYNIDIPPARLDFSGDNTLYLELSPGDFQQEKLLGRLWPEQGKITGQVRLEAVPETTIDVAKTIISYKPSNQQIIVSANLKHHQSLEYGPWILSGTIKDKEQKVAECLLPLNSNGEYEQQVDLVFNLLNAKLWNTENPFLYELDLVLSNSRGDYDRVQMPIGVREYAGTSAKWILNKKDIDVKGEILTQDQESIIRNQRQVETYLEGIKAKGFNVLYFMGFFPDEGWLYAADKLGVGVWLELPVNLRAKEKVPQVTALEELILIAERHPSVLAWTAAKALEPSAETEEYLQRVRERLNSLPVYHLLLPGQGEPNSPEEITLETKGLMGQWGQVEYNQDEALHDVTRAGNSYALWQDEKIVAISWLFILIFIRFQNIRRSSWNYKELFNPNPKRAVRRALFWSCLRFISRMVTLGAVIISLLFRIPLTLFPWLPYDTSFLVVLKNQNPFLLWLFISFSLMLIRLLRVGLAAPSFPGNPRTLDLCCWLERRHGWMVLVGIAWVMLVYGRPWYIPFAVYILLTFLLLPLRIRDVWRAGGKYSRLLLLPVTLVLVGALVMLRQGADFVYLFKIVSSRVKIIFPQIFG